MKKLLLILLCLPMIGFGQQTYVPDDNFEASLEAQGMGNGIANDNYVATSIIDTLTTLNVNNQSISNLTGIEEFTALTLLNCSENELTSLDVSSNTALEYLRCSDNQLTNLDVSQNTALEYLGCGENQLTSLDVSNNTALEFLTCYLNQLAVLNVSNNTALYELWCGQNNLYYLDVSGVTALSYLVCHHNQLQTLNLSNNTALTHLECDDNQLVSLNLKNGNNNNHTFPPYIFNNPNLYCIDVDDAVWSTTNWSGSIDPQHYFSNNCSGTSVEEHTTNTELLKVTDLLGRETKQTNQPLFYIYDDGTVEKRIVIE